jgi:hypothetical protein
MAKAQGAKGQKAEAVEPMPFDDALRILLAAPPQPQKTKKKPPDMGKSETEEKKPGR